MIQKSKENKSLSVHRRREKIIKEGRKGKARQKVMEKFDYFRTIKGKRERGRGRKRGRIKCVKRNGEQLITGSQNEHKA